MTVTGLEDLTATLKDNVTLDDVKRIVKHNGERLVRKMVRQTTEAYVKGYSHGDTAGSINKAPILEDNGLTAVVKAQTAYVEYVEGGTRYMNAEPIVLPSLDVVGRQFLNDLKRVSK